MPIINWVGKDSIINHDKDVKFRLLKKNESKSVSNSENLIVEGDNLGALKALLPYYQNKIKCIYIDPPYNTGNENWVYNDNVNSPKIKRWLGKVVGGEGEDLTRHDKWLCMMYPRLKLLRELLKEDGVIFISIDDNEVHNLKMILEEIFKAENFIADIIWEKRYGRSNDAKLMSVVSDHILLFRKSNSLKKLREPRTEKSDSIYSNPDKDHRGKWTSVSFVSQRTKAERPNLSYPLKNPNTGKIFVHPTNSWKYNKKKYDEFLKENRFYWGKDGKQLFPRIKRFLSELPFGLVPVNLWNFEETGTGEDGTREVEAILGKDVFQYPKPVSLLKRILNLASVKDNDIVLDSFAGSGTTAEAVLQLNREDKGNRKFILVELESDICKNITSKRVKKIIEGYKFEKYQIMGTGGGFQYCTLDKPLFNEEGRIDESCTFEDLASYIYFTETRMILNKKSIKKNYIGTNNDTDYYLIFKEINKNTLEKKFLTLLDKKERKVIYADKCLISDEILELNNITFKQIPYEVRIF